MYRRCSSAYRERFDGADVVHLIRARGKTLDWARLLHLTGSHWELLFWSLVLFAYVYPAHTDDVAGEHLGRSDGEIFSPHQEPARDAPFRGTLVDPRMFAIDVNEWGERNLYQEYCAQHPAMLGNNNSHGSSE